MLSSAWWRCRRSFFANTQIPACPWFLSHEKSGAGERTDRHGQVLFIDARALGKPKTRVFRVFDKETIRQISATYHAWRGPTVDFDRTR
jgi:type I restriction enzyme M protein